MIDKPIVDEAEIITDVEHAAKRMSETKDKIRNAVTASSVGLFFYQDEQGKITFHTYGPAKQVISVGRAGLDVFCDLAQSMLQSYYSAEHEREIKN
jgi:hypothetical protein